jgi:hypothetical protein
MHSRLYRTVTSRANRRYYDFPTFSSALAAHFKYDNDNDNDDDDDDGSVLPTHNCFPVSILSTQVSQRRRYSTPAGAISRRLKHMQAHAQFHLYRVNFFDPAVCDRRFVGVCKFV